MENYNLDEIRNWIEDTMRDAEFDESEFEIVDLRAYGSRTTGRATKDSDLDILVEYKGLAREDTVFNTLHKKNFGVNNVSVDINPIKEECSGTIDEYLSRCDDNWKEPVVHRRRGR